jgi:large subunit ribosomal protein L6
MSRIGKKPIQIPAGAEAKKEGQKIIIKGPKGELSREISPEIKFEIKENNIFVSLQAETKRSAALWGLSRALIFNMVKGVCEGFSKKLQLSGIGYKVRVEGNKLILNVGFSHSVEIESPVGIQFDVDKNNIITVSGIDKELVGQLAAKIRKVKPADPYQGKGLKYEGEIVRRKEGKKVAATSGG